jgi:peptidoglycan hydrolase CwlO-like protein
MTNRVDELESDIAELRAAVNGLTEELVETKARVRELETEADTESETEVETADTEADFVDAESVEASASKTTTKSDDHVEVVEQESAETETVAKRVAGASEGDNSPEKQESTEDDADQGDIIVA